MATTINERTTRQVSSPPERCRQDVTTRTSKNARQFHGCADRRSCRGRKELPPRSAAGIGRELWSRISGKGRRPCVRPSVRPAQGRRRVPRRQVATTCQLPACHRAAALAPRPPAINTTTRNLWCMEMRRIAPFSAINLFTMLSPTSTKPEAFMSTCLFVPLWLVCVRFLSTTALSGRQVFNVILKR